jgi:hypothetical protein
MSEINKLANNIMRRVAGAQQAQIRFVECVSVDWDNKTMTAKGTSDDVEYYDITLGYGYVDIKPAIGTVCLIGIIEGQDVVTFLMDAEEVDLVEINSKKIVFNGGKHSGIPMTPEVTQRLNAIEKAFNSLLNEYKAHNHSHPQGPTTGFVTPPTTTNLTETKIEDIANKDITQ